MIYLWLTIVCLFVFIYAKNRTTSDWLSLCSVAYGGTSVRYGYLVVTIISLVLTIVFGYLCHTTIINYINKLMG